MLSRTIRSTLALAALSMAVAGGVSIAQTDSIAQRHAIFEEFGKVSKGPGAMLKGKAPFDLAAVQKALATFSAGSPKLIALFPDNSKVGGKTEALPRIWDEKTRFNGMFEKLAADATAAAAEIKDEASFKASFGKIFGDCKACHDDYRKKDS